MYAPAGKGRWRHNEARVQLNCQSAGAEANGVEEHYVRVLADDLAESLFGR